MQLHPLPDLAATLARGQPADRLRAVLLGYYRWYRETAPMAEWVQRDRAAVAALDELLRRTADVRLDQLAHQLATALPADGRPVEHTRVLVRLALDFWTCAGWTGKVLTIPPPSKSWPTRSPPAR